MCKEKQKPKEPDYEDIEKIVKDQNQALKEFIKRIKKQKDKNENDAIDEEIKKL